MTLFPTIKSPDPSFNLKAQNQQQTTQKFVIASYIGIAVGIIAIVSALVAFHTGHIQPLDFKATLYGGIGLTLTSIITLIFAKRLNRNAKWKLATYMLSP